MDLVQSLEKKGINGQYMDQAANGKKPGLGGVGNGVE